MSLWVSVHRIKREPFLTLSDELVANYLRLKEFLEFGFKEIDELTEYPSLKELRQYIPKNADETNEVYYDRACAELPIYQQFYSKNKAALEVGGKEQAYLEKDSSHEELFFLKRCYVLAENLEEKFPFKKEILPNEDEYLHSLVLDESLCQRFNELTNSNIQYDKDYITYLYVG